MRFCCGKFNHLRGDRVPRGMVEPYHQCPRLNTQNTGIWHYLILLCICKALANSHLSMKHDWLGDKIFLFISNTHTGISFRLAHNNVSLWLYTFLTLYWGSEELKLTCWDMSFCWTGLGNVLPFDKLLWLDTLRCEQIWWACWDTSWYVVQFSSLFYLNHTSHLSHNLNKKNKELNCKYIYQFNEKSPLDALLSERDHVPNNIRA